jgi:rhodanese-related sulfurtransferase
MLSLHKDPDKMKFYFAATLTLILGTTAVAQSNSYKTINVVQADSLIKSHLGLSDFVLLDVRTPAEYITERIDKSRNLDGSAAYFNDSIEKLDKNRIYLVYCGSGGRSPGACSKMMAKSFKTVYNMQQGLSAWKSAGFPTVKGSGTGIDNNPVSYLVVKIYPNPVVDLSTLEIDGFIEGEVKIEILNALGSLVLSQKMVPGRAITLNGRDLSPGLYFYRLVLPQNQVKSGRFQVAR